MRVNVRVYPTGRRTEVGGRYGAMHPPVLIVRVSAPRTDGRANKAVVDALAIAFGVPRSGIRVMAGSTNRNKVIDIDQADPAVLAQLLHG